MTSGSGIRGVERVDEAHGLRNVVPAGGQGIAIGLPTLAIVRDEEDARRTVEGIHVMT